MTFPDSGLLERWLSALEARHLADLRFAEVTRALRALSAAYVQRRGAAVRTALDSAGKRAAFSLFYAPLHLLTVHAVVRALSADAPPPHVIADLGCGTGAAGAAWALAAGGATVRGIDRHPWAVAEANWTYGHLGVRGRARQGDVSRLPSLEPGDAIVAAYVLNELTADIRGRVETQLVESAARGARVLVIEPIAHSVTPWWDAAAVRFSRAGGRSDEWRIPIELPQQLKLMDRAAGLDHRELTARSIYCPGHGEATTRKAVDRL